MVSGSPLDGKSRIQFELIFIRASVGVFIFSPQTKGESPATATGEVRGEWQREQRPLVLSSCCTLILILRCNGTDGDRCRCEGGALYPCRDLSRHCRSGATLQDCQEDKGSNLVPGEHEGTFVPTRIADAPVQHVRPHHGPSVTILPAQSRWSGQPVPWVRRCAMFAMATSQPREALFGGGDRVMARDHRQSIRCGKSSNIECMWPPARSAWVSMSSTSRVRW